MSNAIEFTAIAHDGVIDLPEPYSGQWNRKRVRVICQEADMAATEVNSIDIDEAFGLWRRQVSPTDGLEYQERLRSEWPE